VEGLVCRPFAEWLTQLTPGKRRSAATSRHDEFSGRTGDRDVETRKVEEEIPELARYVWIRQLWQFSDTWLVHSERLGWGYDRRSI
jgi:hypothetical protein